MIFMCLMISYDLWIGCFCCLSLDFWQIQHVSPSGQSLHWKYVIVSWVPLNFGCNSGWRLLVLDRLFLVGSGRCGRSRVGDWHSMAHTHLANRCSEDLDSLFRNQQLAHLAVEFGSRMDDEWIMFKVGLDSWIKYNAITANTYYNIYCILYIYILTLLIIIVWLYYNQWHQISLLSPAQNGGVESHQVAQRNIDFAETCSDPGHTSFQ